jgi:hypothetical protein
MEKSLTSLQITNLATINRYEAAALKAVINVESSGHGSSEKTGKIIIQFEPSWFKRKYVDWKDHQINHTWVNNGVDDQTAEWKAFNDAFSISPNAAMESTSIGMMQVMGFHWKLLGFKSVGEMWDYAKESEANQVDLGIRFIKANPTLDAALKTKTWRTFALYYNGQNYEKFNYHNRLATEYEKALK